MTADLKWDLVSVEEYLASEIRSPRKREYVEGAVYFRPDERIVHHRVASNVLGELHVRLEGHSCEAWNSDTRIRIRMPGGRTRFYYPDASVVCRSNPPHEYFQDRPAAIAEVLSRRTRRIDEVEKNDGYQTIPSLRVYMLIEQDEPLVTVYRRGESGFEREVYSGMEAVIPLPELDSEMPLSDVYDRVQFVPEPSDEDEP